MNLKKLAGLAKNKNKREMTNYQNQKRKSRHGGLKTLAKNVLCNHSNPTIGNYQDLPGRPHCGKPSSPCWLSTQPIRCCVKRKLVHSKTRTALTGHGLIYSYFLAQVPHFRGHFFKAFQLRLSSGASTKTPNSPLWGMGP